MVPHRVALRVVKLCFVVLPWSMLAACRTEPGPEISRKDPAEITLPKESFTPQLLERIERDLARFDWGPAHDRCDGCPAANDVTIRYTGKTKDIRGNNGPQQQRIVALIQNHSAQDVLHRPTNTTFSARTKYLMWVHRNKNSEAVWGFIELGPNYKPRPDNIWLLQHCRDADSPTDDADFKNCGEKHAIHPSSGLIKRAYAAPQGSRSLTAFISKPSWIGCDPDCCTGTNQRAVY
jgi:hypothetical protein